MIDIVKNFRDVQTEQVANSLLSPGKIDFLGQYVQCMFRCRTFSSPEMILGDELMFCRKIEQSGVKSYSHPISLPSLVLCGGG